MLSNHKKFNRMKIYFEPKYLITKTNEVKIDRKSSNIFVAGCFQDVKNLAVVIVKLAVGFEGVIDEYKIYWHYTDNISTREKNTEKLEILLKIFRIKHIIGNKLSEYLNNGKYENWETVSLDLDKSYLNLDKSVLINNRLTFYDDSTKLKWCKMLDNYDHNEIFEGKFYHEIFALYNIIENCEIDYNKTWHHIPNPKKSEIQDMQLRLYLKNNSTRRF